MGAAVRPTIEQCAMTVGEHDPADFPTVSWLDYRPIIASRLKDPRLINALNVPYWINFDYDVAYVCGICTSLRGVFCDRNVPLRNAPVGRNGELIDLAPFVWLHECAEWCFIELWGDTYLFGHSLITIAEHDAVIAAGISWRKYCVFFDAYDRRDETVTNINRTPRTLYQRPYIECSDYLLLQRMRETMA
jgi:hypothetical protein